MQTHLLLVDDDPADLALISEGLTQRWEGLVQTTAATAEEALRLLAISDYDVIVSDVRLPGKDGIQLATESSRTHPDVPIFLITAFGPSTKEEGLRAGASGYLQKPLDLDRLVRTIREAIEKAKLRRRVRDANNRSSQQAAGRSAGEPVRKEIREFFRSTELIIALLREGEPLTQFEWQVFENCSLHLRSFLAMKESLESRRSLSELELPPSDSDDTKTD